VTVIDRLREALAERYLIQRELGHGGMATVYLAEDLKHRRKVAVKVLRPELAAALGGDRFMREIEIAARLQHPHILPLLDSGASGEFLYYVMPFVEGESLRDRLVRGELPVPDAIRIMAEVADALANAHGHGVVHRDIKPDNILLSGRHALVADFGVAKAVSEATGGSPMTTAGVALGTPAYMAPEQAMADPHLDHRVDIYALGVVGYEMLAGHPVFRGSTAQALLAAHATQEPESLERARPGLSPVLAAVVHRCLAKRPADRWQRAADLLAQLEPLLGPSADLTPVGTQPMAALRGRSHRTRWMVAGAIAALAIVAALALYRSPTPVPRVGQRLTVTREPGVDAAPAVSPDGKLVAYVRPSGGIKRLFTRQIEGGAPVQVSPQSVVVQLAPPSWSPDGQRLLYATDRGLEVVPALGGVSKVLVAEVGPRARWGSWSPGGDRIAYTTDSVLWVRGVEDQDAARLATGRELHSPVWSPDGRWIAYASGNAEYVPAGNIAPSAIWVVRTSGGDPVRVMPDQPLHISPVWLGDSRRLLFVSNRDGGRDVYQVMLGAGGGPSGPPVRLTTGLNPHTISVSADGRRLAYAVLTETANVHRGRMRSGGALSLTELEPVTTGAQIIEGLDVTPDGRTLYFDSDRNGNADIFRMSLDGTEAAEAITSAPEDEFQPNLSPDGQRVAYYLIRGSGVRDLMLVDANGSRPERVPVATKNNFFPTWSRDGRKLLYRGDMAIWLVERQGPGGWGQERFLQPRLALGAGPGVWSPAGDMVYATDSLGTTGRLLSLTGQVLRSVIRLPPARTGLRERWSDDGATIYQSALGPGGEFIILAAPAAGGPQRVVVDSRGPSSQTYRHSFDVQGDMIYVSVADRQADVFVVELEEP